MNRIKRVFKITAVGSTILILLALVLSLSLCAAPINGWPSPLEALDPFCRYEPRILQKATVIVAGETLESEIVMQRGDSRAWISAMNSAGCGSQFGNAHVFRMRNDDILLMSPIFCRETEKKLVSGETALCLQSNEYIGPRIGFVISNAVNPVSWRRIDLDDKNEIVLVVSTFQKTWLGPKDRLESLSPSLLHTDFAGRGSLPSAYMGRFQKKDRKFLAKRSDNDKAIIDPRQDSAYCISEGNAIRCTGAVR